MGASVLSGAFLAATKSSRHVLCIVYWPVMCFFVCFCFTRYTRLAVFFFLPLLMWPCATERTFMSIVKYGNYI